MGLFRKKEIWEYKQMQKVDCDLTEVLPATKKEEKDRFYQKYCKKIAETDEFNFFAYQCYADFSNGYIIRQTKKKPSEKIYLGKKFHFFCVFHDYILTTEQTGEYREHYLKALNFKTGDYQKFSILSNEHRVIMVIDVVRDYHNDTILDMRVENDLVVFDVKTDPGKKDKKSLRGTYQIYLDEKNGEFSFNRSPFIKETLGSVWRNAKGKVACPGDNCPQKDCDNTCPIWLNTQALPLMSCNEFDKAIELYKNALELAPDFYDAWNNMASAYGSTGRYKEAKEAYLKAHEIDAEKLPPLFGLSLACKDLEEWEECIKYSSEYLKHKDDQHVRAALEIAKNNMNSNKAEEQKASPTESIHEKYGQIVMSLFDDVEAGYKKMETIEDAYPEAAVMLGQYWAQYDHEVAKKHFEIAANAGIAEGLWGYAGYINHNRVPNTNNAQDMLWVKSVVAAAEGGCPDAMNEVGNIYSRLGNFFLSEYWYQMAEMYEHKSATYGVNGIAEVWEKAGRPKVPTEYKDDVRYHQGYLFLMNTIESWEDDSENIVFDHIENLAQKEGYSACALLAAQVNEESNPQLAAQLYRLAANQKDLMAMRSLANMLFFGVDMPRDIKAASALYLDAATLGEKNSCFVLGEFARSEGEGNKAIAAMWYAKAHVRGFNGALDRIKQMIKG